MNETSQKLSFMDKFQAFAEKTLLPMGLKIGNQRHLSAIRDGMAILIPITIIGGFAILLAVPPVPAGVTEPSNFLYAFLLAWQAWAKANSSILMVPYQFSIGCISLFVICGIAFYLAKSYNLAPLPNIVTSLFVFLVVSDAIDLANGTLAYSKFSASYMFGAMIVTIVVVEVNRLFIQHNITIKLPDSVPPNVSAPFVVLFPLMAEVIGFTLINILVTNLTGAGFTSLMTSIFQPLLSASGSLPSLLLISSISTLFWFFGIHGDNMVSPITSPIVTAGLAANLEAYAAGTPSSELPFIFAGSMLAVYSGWIVMHVFMIHMKFTCKSTQLNSLVKISFIPALFNINEPNVFGMPTVLNVYTLIPQILCNIIGISGYYFLCQLHLVGRTFVSLPFTTPVPLQAFLTTMDWRNLVYVIVLYVVFYFVSFPFLKAYDNQLLKQEAENA